MKTNPPPSSDPAKARTGIEGFDEITRGGLPRGRTTLIEGGPGSGKTILALQALVNGARLDNEPGIFVAFEETSERIVANAAQFGWDLGELQKKKLFFLNAQPTVDLVQSGEFDLSGMLAALDAQVRAMQARRIVFDALDIVLVLLRNPLAEQREMYRLHDWLIARGLTAIITSKAGGTGGRDAFLPQMGFLEFMVDCAVVLKHELVLGESQRNLRVLKYRGSEFSENESPLAFGECGIEVAGERRFSYEPAKVTSERVSSGIARFDTMLGGGYYRGANVLVTGSPGAAKTTLGGAFAEAACARGERTLFVSFDSDPGEIVRNLASVNIRLARFEKQGLLLFKYARNALCSREVHFMRIKALVRKHKVRNLVIDPVSALSKEGNELAGYGVVERLTAWAKTEGVTPFFTSLLDNTGPELEGTPMQISTIADTWIHLSYHARAGERNRALTIIKSRGTAHSNQVRELVLSDKGITLADAYTAGGEVLMGTLRWEKERAVRDARDEAESTKILRQAKLDSEEALLVVRLKAVQLELEMKRAEQQALAGFSVDRAEEMARGSSHLDELRGVDEK